MADQKVRTSVTDWRTEVNRAEAASMMDSPDRPAVDRQPQLGEYVFSNGKRFRIHTYPKDDNA